MVCGAQIYSPPCPLQERLAVRAFTMEITIAKGPDGPGFQRRRRSPPVEHAIVEPTIVEPTIVEPEFTYVVDQPYGKWWKDPEPIPGRHYYNMRLDDFEDYKALGEPLKLHGPAPYRPHLCGCNRYYLCRGMCVCSMSCREKPLYAWMKAHPEEFKAKQKEMRRWRMLADIWWKQQDTVSQQWESISWSARMRFYHLQDEESPIGCASCERDGCNWCKCECDNCGSKWCPGNCCDDDDRDYY